ncbi:MAG: TatD family deoxyribonuclease [Candidatus Saccharibacteria bacterium]|nr:TatD family deoxyribonuclease [Candidatus Saccharibacteria bacterium]
MEFVDTHCHIQSAGQSAGERSTRELWSKAPELTGDQLVVNAAAAGVTRLICVGCDLEDSQLAIDFAQGHDYCWASIGIHPHEAALHGDKLEAFAALAEQPKVVAIGECGLDYYYEHSPREDQIAVLKFQLELAIKTGLPVIFHVREAFNDFWPIFDSFPAGSIRGVLHSFTDSQSNVDEAVKRGLYLGVNGIATFAKNPAQLDVYRSIPADHLLLETDAPFLTPVPFRGKVNEPKQITTVAEFLASLRGVSLEELAQITTSNAHTLFDV